MTSSSYIALVHKDANSIYGISFPDVPGVTAAEDTFEDVVREGAAALGFAFEDWTGERPRPRTIEQLRLDPAFLEWAADAIVVAVRPNEPVYQAAQ